MLYVCITEFDDVDDDEDDKKNMHATSASAVRVLN